MAPPATYLSHAEDVSADVLDRHAEESSRLVTGPHVNVMVESIILGKRSIALSATITED